MASFGQTFDASAVAPSTSYDVLPPGKYLGQIVASEMRPTKDGTGQYLYMEVDILEGQYAGRKLFDRLNLVNANPDTVEIAKRTLSSICRAVGKMQVSNSEQLHLVPMTLDVRVRPPKGLYGESNAIRYLPRGGASGAATQPTQPFTPPQAPVAGRPITAAPTATPAANGLPWKRQAYEDAGMHEHAPAATPIRLPSTLQGCRERLAALQDEIASIRIQIATTDIRRQTEKKSLDATWFHRAKTALRLKLQELAQLTAHMAKLNAAEPGGHREQFKDALIEVLRADCDDERWQSAVTRARELHAKQGVQHG